MPFLSGLTDSLVAFAVSIIEIFPESPFRGAIESVQDSEIITILQYVNYILPIQQMITIFSMWIVGVALYYVYQLVLRWIKVID